MVELLQQPAIKKMFYKCDAYIPSTCFDKDTMKYYDNFDTLPRKKGYGIVFIKDKEKNLEKFKNIDWSNVAFLSTNSAYNIVPYHQYSVPFHWKHSIDDQVLYELLNHYYQQQCIHVLFFVRTEEIGRLSTLGIVGDPYPSWSIIIQFNQDIFTNF